MRLVLQGLTLLSILLALVSIFLQSDVHVLNHATTEMDLLYVLGSNMTGNNNVNTQVAPVAEAKVTSLPTSPPTPPTPPPQQQQQQHSQSNNIRHIQQKNSGNLPLAISSIPNTTQRFVPNLDTQTLAAIQARLQADPTWPVLPDWVQDYYTWHAAVRTQFPDTHLLTDPTAPGVLVVLCKRSPGGRRFAAGDCGGTYDRLHRLPATLAYAHATHRILLWKWHIPAPLETFLSPHLCNWTAPLVRNFGLRSLNAKMRQTKLLPEHGGTGPWQTHKILLSPSGVSMSANEGLVDASTLRLGEKQVVGGIFRSFFQPSPPVQARLDRVYHELGIVPGHYTAAHCRVRHPGFYKGRAEGKKGAEADKTGLLFEGRWKERAAEAALMGLKCSARLLQSPEEPVYFMSDSEDLVEYVVDGKGRTNATGVDLAMATATQKIRVVSRQVTGPTLHIDNQPGHPPEQHMETFVDLYLAVSARCVSFGVGNFGFLASLISGTSCTQVHNRMIKGDVAERRWSQQTGGAPVCRQQDVQ